MQSGFNDLIAEFGRWFSLGIVGAAAGRAVVFGSLVAVLRVGYDLAFAPAPGLRYYQRGAKRLAVLSDRIEPLVAARDGRIAALRVQLAALTAAGSGPGAIGSFGAAAPFSAPPVAAAAGVKTVLPALPPVSGAPGPLPPPPVLPPPPALPGLPALPPLPPLSSS